MQPMQPNTPGLWSKRNIIIGVVVLILVCCACGGISQALNGGKDSTSTSTSTTTQQSGPTATPTPTKAPTATPKPKAWVTVHHLTGSATQQTETFHVGGQWRISWKCQKADDFGGNFAVELYNSDGSYGDLVANTTDNNAGVYNGHGDGDVYLKIDTYSENWTVDVQQYQ